MYDFLDKIGLKAVLEAIKGKIPTSLPANGGNADYATVARDTQLFNGKPSGNYVQFLGIVQVDDMSTAPADTYEYLNDSTYQVPYEVAVSPLVSEFVGLPHMWWLIKYYVYGYGNGFSCQTAFPVGFGGVPYIRYSQEGVWSDWKEISTTPIKSVEVGGTTNIYGNFMIWKASDRKIPVYAKISGYYVSPFLIFTADDYYYYLGLCDAESHEWVTNTAVSGTVYYIEI